MSSGQSQVRRGGGPVTSRIAARRRGSNAKYRDPAPPALSAAAIARARVIGDKMIARWCGPNGGFPNRRSSPTVMWLAERMAADEAADRELVAWIRAAEAPARMVG